jgi:uncharacterized protein DUF6338
VISTFQALAVTALALLPGALFTWKLEQQTGPWGLGVSDRVLRFVGSSAVFQAIFAPLTWWFYVHEVRSGRLHSSPSVPWLLWIFALAYVGVPMLVGAVVGTGVRQRKRWAGLIAGRAPAPNAWDQVFTGRQAAWIRLRLKNPGGWLMGAYAPAERGPDSYAAGSPDGGDLYLTDTIELNPETGRPLLGPDGSVIFRGYGLLIRWDEVAYMEVSWTPKAVSSAAEDSAKLKDSAAVKTAPPPPESAKS